MRCPRNKFINLDYNLDLVEQQQDICKICPHYNGNEWGKHCTVRLTCVKCNKILPADYLFKLVKSERGLVTHGICDSCKVLMNDLVDKQRKKLGRRPW